MSCTTRGSAAAALLTLGAAFVACQRASVYHLVGTVERTTIEVAAPVSEKIVEVGVKRGSESQASLVLEVEAE